MLLLPAIASAQTNTDCGTERWSVKTLTDPDTSSISWTASTSSVREQVTLSKVTPHQDDPRLPSERILYEITGLVTKYKLEDDGDIHIVLKDNETDSTIVIEMPNPDCPSLQGTSFVTKYRDERDWFVTHIGNPTSSFKTLPTPKQVTITGVGFYDFLHGQTGMAKNGREIHPVLSITDAASFVAPASDLHFNVSIAAIHTPHGLHLRVRITGGDTIEQIRISRIDGRLEHTIDGFGKDQYDGVLPISTLAAGVHILQVNTSSSSITQKLVVK
jgi:hypothetical protein